MPEDELDMTFDELKKKQMITTSFNELLKIVCVQNIKGDYNEDYTKKLDKWWVQLVNHTLETNGAITKAKLNDYKARSPEKNTLLVYQFMEKMDQGGTCYSNNKKTLLKRILPYLSMSPTFIEAHDTFPKVPGDKFRCTITGVYAWLIGIAIFPFIRKINASFSVGGILDEALDFKTISTMSQESLRKKYKVVILKEADAAAFDELKKRIFVGIKKSCDRDYMGIVTNKRYCLVDTSPFFSITCISMANTVKWSHPLQKLKHAWKCTETWPHFLQPLKNVCEMSIVKR